MTRQEITAVTCGYIVLFSAIYLVTQCPRTGCFSGGATARAPTTFQECLLESNHTLTESFPQRCALPDGTVFTESVAPADVQKAEITVATPKPGSSVGLPLEVRGQVVGRSGEVHYQLLDVDGSILSEGTIETQAGAIGQPRALGASVTYPQPYGHSGSLVLRVLEKTSGTLLGETRVPVTFQPQAGEEVQVFFRDTHADPDGVMCDAVKSVTRRVAEGDPVRSAVAELLAGPTDPERHDGAQTAIPDGVTIQSLSMLAGVLRLDFSDKLLQDVPSGCRLTAIKSQIQETLKQFHQIKRVDITVNGSQLPTQNPTE